MDSPVKQSCISGAVILGTALVLCAVIGSWTVLEVKNQNQTLTVTGAAYKTITSDYAIWQGTVATFSPALDQAYTKIDKDMKLLLAFLEKAGWDSSSYVIEGVQLYKRNNREGQTVGYDLSQSVTIESPEIQRTSALSKDVSSLIDKGVELRSHPPRYLYTHLDAMKLEMIHLATENARDRAEQLADASDTEVGALRSASVGVFQIRPLHSQSVSDYGMSDETSIAKEIACTIHASFGVE